MLSAFRNNTQHVSRYLSQKAEEIDKKLQKRSDILKVEISAANRTNTELSHLEELLSTGQDVDSKNQDLLNAVHHSVSRISIQQGDSSRALESMAVSVRVIAETSKVNTKALEDNQTTRRTRLRFY